jgi:hypothetical protein
MTLALADVQTPLPQLLQTEVYTVQELPQLRLIDAAAQRALHALVAPDVVSLRAIVLRQYFMDALQEWRNEVGFSSLLEEKRTTATFRRIVDMGEEAIPFLLEEIASRPSLMFMALHEITGDDPIAPDHRGRVTAMVEVWLRWGREHGISR